MDKGRDMKREPFWNWKQIVLRFPLWQGEMKGLSLRSSAFRGTSVHLDLTLILSASLCPTSTPLLLSSICTLAFSHHASRRQRGSSDSRSSDELPTQGGYRGLHPSTSGSEEGVQDLCEVGVHPQLNTPSMEQLSGAHCTGTRVHMVVVQHKNITILNGLLLPMNNLSYSNSRLMLFFFLCYLWETHKHQMAD